MGGRLHEELLRKIVDQNTTKQNRRLIKAKLSMSIIGRWSNERYLNTNKMVADQYRIKTVSKNISSAYKYVIQYGNNSEVIIPL